MYLINLQAKPKKESEHYKQYAGAFVSVYVDYKDLDGAIKLAKHYVKEEGWKVTKVEDEYFSLNSEEDVNNDKDQVQLYKEALEFGYSIIINCYEEEDEE